MRYLCLSFLSRVYRGEFIEGAPIYVGYRDFLHDESCDYNIPPSFEQLHIFIDITLKMDIITIRRKMEDRSSSNSM